MKNLLILPVLCWYSVAFAQTKPADCAAVIAENTVLKEKIVAYEARLGIGVGGVTVVDGDDKIKVKFLSCKASKSKHNGVFSFMIENLDEPATIGIATNNGGGGGSTVSDEQGQGYLTVSPSIGAQYAESGGVSVQSHVPVKSTIEFSGIPLSVSRLNNVVIAFTKTIPGMNTSTRFKTVLKNMPIIWIP